MTGLVEEVQQRGDGVNEGIPGPTIAKGFDRGETGGTGKGGNLLKRWRNRARVNSIPQGPQYGGSQGGEGSTSPVDPITPLPGWEANTPQGGKWSRLCKRIVRRIQVATRKPAWRSRLRPRLSSTASLEPQITVGGYHGLLLRDRDLKGHQVEGPLSSGRPPLSRNLDGVRGPGENIRPPFVEGYGLRVQVQGARRLTAADMDSSSHPFCIVRLGHREWTTQVLPHTLNPQWGETFTFSSQDLLSSDLVLELEVWSWDDWHPNDFLGQAHVNLRQLPLDVGPSTPALVVPLYCMTPSGHKEGGDFGDVVLAVWTVPESDKCEREARRVWLGGPQGPAPASPASPSPALPAALPDGPVTSLCELPDVCKQLPSLLHTDKGTIYEEPCIVLIQITLGSLTITRPPEGVLLRVEQTYHRTMKRRVERASKLVDGLLKTKGVRRAGAYTPGAYNEEEFLEDDEMEIEQPRVRLPLHAWSSRHLIYLPPSTRHTSGDDDDGDDGIGGGGGGGGDGDGGAGDGDGGIPPVDATPVLKKLKQLRWSWGRHHGGGGGAHDAGGPQGITSEDNSGYLGDTQKSTSLLGDRGMYMYCEVEYAKQVQTTRMRHTGGRGHVCVDHTFLFADVRPLRDRRVTITTYCSTTPSSRGRVAGMAEVNLRDLVMASAAAQLRDVGEGRPANRGSVYGDPLQMVELMMKEDQGTLQLHVGLADVDYRAQIHKVDLQAQVFNMLPSPLAGKPPPSKGTQVEDTGRRDQMTRGERPSTPHDGTQPPGTRLEAQQGPMALAAETQPLAVSPYSWGAPQLEDDPGCIMSESSPGAPRGQRRDRSPSHLHNKGTSSRAPAGEVTPQDDARNSSDVGFNVNAYGASKGPLPPTDPSLAPVQFPQGPHSAPGSFKITLQRVDVFSPEVPFFLVIRCGPLWVRTKTFPPGSAAILDWPLELPLYAPNVSLRLALFSDPSGEGAGLTLLVKSTPELLGRGGLNLGRVTPWKDKDKAVNIRGAPSSSSDPSPGPLVGVCHMRVRLHYPSVWTLLLAYITPPHPPAFYELGLDGQEEHVTLKAQRKILTRWLSRSNPPLHPVISRILLETGREKFTLDRLKTNFSRISQILSSLNFLLDMFEEICQWQDPLRSLVACGLVVLVSLHPSYVLAVVALVVGMIVWRQAMDEEEQLGDDKGERPGEERHRGSEVGSISERGTPVTGNLDEEEDPQVPLGAYSDLKRRYNQVVHRVLVVQNVLDDLACTMERLQALATSEDKAATGLFATGCVIMAILVYGMGVGVVMAGVGLWVIRPPLLRDPLPPSPSIFFSRLPTRSDPF